MWHHFRQGAKTGGECSGGRRGFACLVLLGKVTTKSAVADRRTKTKKRGVKFHQGQCDSEKKSKKDA